MSDLETLWEERLADARVKTGRGLVPSDLAQRYDVDDAEEVQELTVRATLELVKANWSTLTLDELDKAAKVMGVEIREPATQDGEVA